MRSHIPKPLQTLLIGDDASLLAELSAIFARKRAYLAVLDGPRIHRPDLDHEVIRRNNAVALVKPTRILFAGLPPSTCDLFGKGFLEAERLASAADVIGEFPSIQARSAVTWGRKRIRPGTPPGTQD